MAPVRLTPKPHRKLWGSKILEPWYANQPEDTGELWFEGPAGFEGAADPPLPGFEGPPNPPLLVKLLFTSGKLSVQVHPDDAYALKHHGSRGKTEMWHVLNAEPGARIAAGFVRDISEQELRESAHSGEIMNLLEWYDASAGDTFFIPAGTVHAIGEGLVLCEIQQNSDVTYRLYDHGRNRELQLDDAIRVSRRTPHQARAKPEGRTLVRCAHFITERVQLAGSLRHTPAQGRAEWWAVVEGSGEIGSQPMRAGEVWYVEPGAAASFELRGDAVLLRSWAPYN